MLQPSQHESHPILCFPPLNWFIPGSCHVFHGGAIYPYLSISIHHNCREHLESGELHGQRLQGRRHRDDSTAVPGGQKRAKRETIHHLLQHSSCLSDKSNALEFCPSNFLPPAFISIAFGPYFTPTIHACARHLANPAWDLWKKTLSDSWHTRMMCDWGTFPEPAGSCSDSVCCWGLLCQGQRSPANAPKSAGPSQRKRLKP